MRITYCFLFICLLSFNVFGQTNAPFKINSKDITLASDKSFRWYEWKQAPNDIKTAAKYIFTGEDITLLDEAEYFAAQGCGVKIAAIDLDGNGVFGLGISTAGKLCCNELGCGFYLYDNGGVSIRGMDGVKVEGELKPTKNGIVSGTGKIFQLVETERFGFDEIYTIKVNKNAKLFQYIENAIVPTLKLFDANQHEDEAFVDSVARKKLDDMAAKKPSATETTLKAGDVSPNAKVLDVDEFANFQEGFCIVRKGTKSGLIDSLGNLVINFSNKVSPSTNGRESSNATSLTESNSGFSEGMCAVNDITTGLVGYMNRKLELVIPCIYTEALPFKNGFAKVTISKPTFNPPTYFSGFINKKGERVNIVTNYYKELSLIPKPNSTKLLYGYTDVYGKLIIPYTYDNARAFSDGLAGVMKIDQFGKPQWGYINSTGTLVIDYKYSNEPGDFYNGLAVVIPTDKTEFEYAYINKSGQVKLTIDRKKFPAANTKNNHFMDKTTIVSPSYKFGFDDDRSQVFKKGAFIDGLAMIINSYGSYGFSNNVNLIDTFGNTHLYPIVHDSYYSPKMRKIYSGEGNAAGYGNFRIELPFLNGITKLWMTGQTWGVINKENEIVIPPVFDDIIIPDKSYELIKAKYISYNNNNEKTERTGFINTQGIFVIIKSKDPKW